MDMQFLQDLKDNKQLSAFGMSQETIDFANDVISKTSLREVFERHEYLFDQEEILSTSENVSVEKDSNPLN